LHYLKYVIQSTKDSKFGMLTYDEEVRSYMQRDVALAREVADLTAKASRKAVKDGRTLEQLDVQSGDEVKIPIKKKVNWQLVTQSLLVVSTLFFAGLQFLQWYYTRQEQ
jgi:hypothetical protein